MSRHDCCSRPHSTANHSLILRNFIFMHQDVQCWIPNLANIMRIGTPIHSTAFATDTKNHVHLLLMQRVYELMRLVRRNAIGMQAWVIFLEHSDNQLSCSIIEEAVSLLLTAPELFLYLNVGDARAPSSGFDTRIKASVDHICSELKLAQLVKLRSFETFKGFETRNQRWVP